MSRKNHRYGWRPQLPDLRDHKFSVNAPVPIPNKIDLSTSPFMPEIWDQGEVGSCFPAGTRIRMASGVEKPIEDVKLLDLIVTAEGNVGKVTKIMVIEDATKITNIRLWGHNYFRVTEEHPILTKRGYIKVKDLICSDWVIMPKYRSNTLVEEINTSKYLAHKTCLKCTKVVHGSVLGRKRSVSYKYPVPNTIKLTYSFGRIVGLFLAEGCTTKHNIVWTFGRRERTTLVEELVRLLKAELNLEARIQIRGNNSINVVIHGSDWAKLFEGLFSHLAEGKRLNEDVMSGSPEFLKAVLEAWLDGDGWKKKTGTGGRLGVTISHDLALAMFDIAQMLGLRPTINWGKAILSPGIIHRFPRWTIGILSKTDNYRIETAEKCVYRKIKEIHIEEFKGPVYNLTVEGDNSYVAEGIGVHNCTAHAICAAFSFELAKQSLPVFMPSRLFLYFNERDMEGDPGEDNGAQIRDGVKSLNTLGICDETLWPYEVLNLTNKPNPECYTAATPNKVLQYSSLNQDLNSLQQVLASGKPFVFGFSVYDSFESEIVAKTGVLNLPTSSEGIVGGHAVLCCGMDNTAKTFLIRNSWGDDWGQKGYFTMPYEYMLNKGLTSDFWCLSLVS